MIMFSFTPLRILTICSSAFWLASSIPLDQTLYVSSSQGHGPVRGRNAAIVCETDICSKVGIALNEAGGNAADMVKSFLKICTDSSRLT